jgi:hypothetical protein
MILRLIFHPDLASMPNQGYDESNTDVFDSRMAIPGQKLAACFSTGR